MARVIVFLAVIGVTIYAAIDCLRSDDAEIRGLPKPLWLLLIVAVPTYGNMAELSVIAAVVVGGTSLSGGKGTVGGTLIGALVIAVIENGMNLTNVGYARQKMVLGGVILGAVLLDRLRNRRG